MKNIKIILILSVIIITANSYGQKNCDEATLLQNNSNFTTNWYSDIYWCKVIPDNESMTYTFSTNNSTNAIITSVNLYHGDCNNLELIQSYDVNDSLFLFEIIDLKKDDNYFFEVFFGGSLDGDFTMYSIIVPDGTPCPIPTICNLVRNPSFEDIRPNIDASSAFELNQVCHWQRAWGTPSWTNMGFPTVDGAFMWTSVINSYPYDIQTEAIFQDGITLQPSVDYEISYDYYSNTDVMTINIGLSDFTLPVIPSTNMADPVPSGFTMFDIGTFNLSGTPINSWNHNSTTFQINSTFNNLVLFPLSSQLLTYNYQVPYVVIDNILIRPKLIFQNLQSPQTLTCAGTSINIQPLIPTANIVQWQWMSNQIGGIISTSQNLQVSPWVSTVYTVTATDAIGCTWIESFIVNIENPRLPLTITQSWTTNECLSSLADFSFVLPSTPNITYTWHVPTGVTIISNSPVNTIHVNWNNIGPGTVTVDGINQSGCIVYHGTLDFNPNTCVSNPIQLNSLTTSQIIATLTAGTSFNNSNIIFNGVINIDADLTFTGCPNLMFGSNARINVMPGKILTFDNCVLKQSCTCAWDGIYAESYTSKVVLKNNSVIRDAKNAIVSANGGNFHITETQFINNKLGLWVRNYNPDWLYDWQGNRQYPGPHPGYIANTTIEKDVTISGFYSQDHLTGIVIDTVYKLMIGDTINISQTNIFSNLQFGIKTKNSQVYIYNNRFYHIFSSDIYIPDYSVTGELNEAAIFCKTEINSGPYGIQMPLKNKILIGGETNSTLKRNKFVECNTGIYGFNTMMEIKHNVFTFSGYNSIYLKDFLEAIVESNSICMWPDITAVNNLNNYAIVADQTYTDAIVRLTIKSNTLGMLGTGILRSGIMMRNCNWNQLDTYSQCIIEDNEIRFRTPPLLSENYYGIKAEHCNYAKITNNNIYPQSPFIPDVTYVGRFVGIYISTTQYAQISTNQIEKMGDGIYVNSTSLGTQYFCNDLDKCWNGFYFNGALLSNQLLAGASDNYWYDISPSATSALRRLTGTISSTGTNWKHQLANSYTNKFSPYLISGHSLFNNITSSPYQQGTCGQIYNPVSLTFNANTMLLDTNVSINNLIATINVPNAINRNQLIGKIVKDSAIYQSLLLENKYMGKEFAFKLLENTPSYLGLGTNEDYLYQNFYNIVNNSNIGKFNQIGKYINAHNYDSASVLNASITGLNTYENNRIAVNGIYLNKVVNNLPFGISDSLTLVNIAYQNSLAGGDAVFSARVMLGIDPIIINTVQSKSVPETENVIAASNIKVYPNPANDILSIELDDETEGKLTLEIFTVTGQLAYSKTINAADKYQTIDIHAIDKGIYYLRISNKDTQVFNQKLVIIK